MVEELNAEERAEEAQDGGAQRADSPKARRRGAEGHLRRRQDIHGMEEEREEHEGE